MKKFIIIIFIACSGLVKGQALYESSVVSGVLNKYLIHRISNSVLIINSKNKLTNIPVKSSIGIYDSGVIGTKIDNIQLANIFRQEIPILIWRTLALESKNFVVVQFKFGTDGKVIDVNFHTQNTTPITPIIFERIENRIKQEIVASFSQKIIPSIGAPAYTTLNYIPYSKEIYFSKL